MKIEAGEKAAVQTLRSSLEEIPLLRVMKISAGKNTSGPDFRIAVGIRISLFPTLQDTNTTWPTKYRVLWHTGIDLVNRH